MQPGTPRYDVTLARESQRLDGVGLFFGKICAFLRNGKANLLPD